VKAPPPATRPLLSVNWKSTKGKKSEIPGPDRFYAV
jgi:hypothetical protein